MANSFTKDELIAEACIQEFSLLDFFNWHLPQLKNIHLKDIQYKKLDDIAARLHGTMLGETEWMAFLNELGIDDNLVISRIRHKSKCSGEFPIYLALRGPLMERLTFGDVIEVIMKYKRHDALLQMKSYVENLLKNPKNHYIPKNPTAPEAEECIEEDIQGTCESGVQKRSREKSHVSRDLVFLKTKLITVLMLHADKDVDIAKKLRMQFKNYGLSAKTLSDFDHLLMTNTSELISALLFIFDFVVPIVSKSFLNQIRSGYFTEKNASPEEFDNEEDITNNNRYIYQLLLNEYRHNKCFNYRVRSVMVPDMDRRLLKDDVLLTNSYKLWKEVPDFITMLIKTKKLLKKECVMLNVKKHT